MEPRKAVDVVIKHADALTTRLTDSNIQARINASVALLRVGKANPEGVRTQHSQLEAALDDPSPEVRANVSTLVANANVPVSVETLRELRVNELDNTVKDHAARALQRLSDE